MAETFDQQLGPLAGLRVLEFESIGAAPFAGMLLADMGADVLLVDRMNAPALGLESPRWSDTMLRGRRSVMLDLKTPGGVQAALELADKADVLAEGFRPGRRTRPITPSFRCRPAARPGHGGRLGAVAQGKGTGLRRRIRGYRRLRQP
mgnify:CR=1 FL=1